MKLKPVRIGLWDQYGGSMPSGWTRWLFEQYEFPFEVVFPQTLDAGNLNAKYDVLVFVDGAHPERDGAAGGGGGGFGAQPPADSVPAEFRGWLGRVDRREDGAGAQEVRRERRHGARRSDRRRRSAITSACRFANALVERIADGAERPLPREKFYVPGSILEARIDNTQPARLRHGRARDGVLRREPGVPAACPRRR